MLDAFPARSITGPRACEDRTMMNRFRVALIAVVAAWATLPRADTVQATSTTIGIARQDYRAGALQTAIPLYEIIDLSAFDLRTPYTDDLEIVLSTWGSVDVANNVRFWQNGALTDKRLTGDVNVGYVRAAFLDKALTLRVGRQLVADGIARMVHLDGAEAKVSLPYHLAISGYIGSPVAPRFAARGGDLTVGNARATLATGGRLSWRYLGLLEAGASVSMATDHGDWARQDIGADIRVTPHRLVQFVGSGWWSLYESRVGEASVAATLFPMPFLDVTLDYRHVEPDLFLPRNSILAVFTSEKRDDVGGALHWGFRRNLALDVDYHALFQPAGTGHWARAKGTWHPAAPTNTVGGELSLLNNPDNSYFLVRAFGAKTIATVFTGTLDLLGYFFDRAVNGKSEALTATATVGYQFARGWRAVIAGSAGTTAYLDRQLDIMAKLVYDQTYSLREVR